MCEMFAGKLRNEHIVAITYVAAVFINALDTTVVIVALPTLSKEFDAGASAIGWVVTGYLLSIAVWIPASGWIGDRLGTKKVFVFAIGLFTLASGLCGLATNLNQLIAFRVLQGVGGGLLTPVGFTMLMRAFPPHQRAMASQILLIPVAIAPALGPIVGGLLVDTISWRWVFLMKLPIGVAIFIFSWIFLREHREPHSSRFDLPGFVLSAAAPALILFSLSRGPADGWGSPSAWGPGLAGAAALGALIAIELRVAAPLLKLRLIADRLFRATMLASVFSSGAFMGLLFLVPVFLQQARGASSSESGLVLSPSAIGVLIFSQVAGRLYPTVGPRRLMTAGSLGMAGTLATLLLVDMHTSFWVISALLFLVGTCFAFILMPLQASAFARISPSDTGHASAIFNTQRQMAGAVGVAVVATILSMALPDGGVAGAESDSVLSAFHTAFLTAAVIAALGAFFAWRIKDADASATMRTEARRGTKLAPSLEG